MTAPTRRIAHLVALGLAFGAGGAVAGQGRDGPTPASAKAAAPVDLGGYWVSVVNKEWRFRMVIPAKGDFFGVIGGIPMNADARRVAEAWDPAKDEATGEACRGFGAAGLMRVPGRLRITWRDTDTLQVDVDAGMQTRVIRFARQTARPVGSRPRGRPTWQGDSVARWVPAGGAREGDGGGPGGTAGPGFGSLEVVTTNLRPGYLRRNGVPYSGETVMTEYWDLFKEPDGTDWLVVTATIVDPTYLQMPYETSPAFKREPDGSKWDPFPCSARW